MTASAGSSPAALGLFPPRGLQLRERARLGAVWPLHPRRRPHLIARLRLRAGMWCWIARVLQDAQNRHRRTANTRSRAYELAPRLAAVHTRLQAKHGYASIIVSPPVRWLSTVPPLQPTHRSSGALRLLGHLGIAAALHGGIALLSALRQYHLPVQLVHLHQPGRSRSLLTCCVDCSPLFNYLRSTLQFSAVATKA